jgi:FAD binding domain-containing protein
VAAPPAADGDLPIRLVAEPAAAPGRRVAPFVGSRLLDWAARCIPSPSGYLYTRVTDWNSTAMESAGGEAIEVTEIGSITLDPGDLVGSVLEWLDAEARTRGVDFEPVTRFEHLVFEEGQVIGAVFTTLDGPFAVRARHGVLVCRAGIPDRRASSPPEAADSVLRVALVSKAASRFGRVELLTSDPAVGGR